MAKQDKPRLGEWVRFTHYHDRPTQEEVEARNEELDGEEGAVSLVRRENPQPDVRGVVVGACTVAFEAPIRYNYESDLPVACWHDSRYRRWFYAVKTTLRGRRFLVTVEDIIKGQTPVENGG